MEDKDKYEKNKEEPEGKESFSSQYMILGMCFGMSLGMLLGKVLFGEMIYGMSVGMCLGIGVGSLIGAAKDKALKKDKDENDTTASDDDTDGSDREE